MGRGPLDGHEWGNIQNISFPALGMKCVWVPVTLHCIQDGESSKQAEHYDLHDVVVQAKTQHGPWTCYARLKTDWLLQSLVRSNKQSMPHVQAEMNHIHYVSCYTLFLFLFF